MSNFIITLDAPDLAKAISALAAALCKETTINLSAPVIAPIPVQTAPVQAPTAPAAPVPVAAAPIAAPAVVPAPVPMLVPTTAPTYSLEQLAVAATPICDAGRRQEMVNLLGSFGVSALTQLSKEQYGAFATALRGMGAKI